ncbi:MAG: Sb-PDE family phosphodiesterase [Gammaproteobacteria bacterium]|nr:Sb-PDE family phosphodiesterase [Gammaproteobacteria bacterium]
MFRTVIAAASLVMLIAPSPGLPHGTVSGEEGAQRPIVFPDTSTHKTLVVDLHTHSVFSDGHVWPTVRVAEAQRDGLDAFAVTEHLEYQPHLTDIPHPDRNRSYLEAKRAAANLDLKVIPGVEITRVDDSGHINAIFVSDANALVKQQFELRRQDEHMFDTREEAEEYAFETSGMFRGAHQVEHDGNQVWMPFDDQAAYFALANFSHAVTRPPEEVLRAANDQGAFLFWNHPDFESVDAGFNDFHATAIESGLLHGIEIANGDRYYQNAHRLALAHDLALIGVSDVHELIAWDYRPDAGENPGHRPVTLVFAEADTIDGIRQALLARRTVVYWKDTLIGRPEHLVPLLEASIAIDKLDVMPWGIRVVLANRSDAPMTLRNATGLHSSSHSGLISLPAHGQTEVNFSADEPAEMDLTFTVLNALVAPNQPAELTLQSR